MVWKVKKVKEDGIEYLPDVTDSPLWPVLNPDVNYHCKKSDRQIAGLYSALRERENYFQYYRPTAFGNPDYSRLCGIVTGFLLAMEAEEVLEGEYIVIRKQVSQKKLLVVDKLTRPQGYYQSCKENRELWRDLGV